jgi:transcriptional regulator with XRE-family HTH domain
MGSMQQTAAPHDASRIGPLLRRWRAARGKSQLDLAMASQVSQRHLSFVESGRSIPSRDMVLTLAAALDVPLRERNTLLLAAGYAPAFHEGNWDAPEMASVDAALQRMLRQQEPYPALVLDRHWNVIRTNHAAPRLFGRFIDLDAVPKPRNLLRLIFDPAGLRPHIADWETLARALIGRVHREAVGGMLDAATRRLLADLARFPGMDPAWQHPEPMSSMPAVPIGLIEGGEIVRYFSMVCTVGTPQAVLTQEFRLECMFPADKESEARHLAMLA